MKRFILVLIFFSGILGCCGPTLPYWNIVGIDIGLYDKRTNNPVNNVVEGDSVSIVIFLKPDFLEAYSNPLRGLMNTAYAWSCSESGYDGLKDKVVQVVMSSDADFNDIRKGEPLNDKLLVNNEIPIAEWIADSETWSYEYNYYISLFFIEKPATPSVHRFNVRFVMESGRVVEQKTEAIQWN